MDRCGVAASEGSCNREETSVFGDIIERGKKIINKQLLFYIFGYFCKFFKYNFNYVFFSEYTCTTLTVYKK